MNGAKPPVALADDKVQAKDAPKVFTGGDQGFIGLKLKNVEEINHNTKKFIFSFDDPNAVSGLNVASALITKHKTDEMEKPVIRPYTPTSDEGKNKFYWRCTNEQ